MTQELGPNQTAWLEALESGKYKQGTGGLRSKMDEYCCLGVACDIARIPSRQTYSKRWEYCGRTAVAPDALKEYLGLRSSVGSARADIYSPDALTELNDNGKTFLEIAAIVRADPSIFFKGPR